MSVLLMSGHDINWDNPPDATDMVKWSKTDTGGDVVKGSLRTIAHMDHTNTRALKRFQSPLTVIQPPFNTGVAASAGTHDFDCCSDWYIPGVPWWDMQRFGRALGWGCWYRHPPTFGNHIHGFTLPVGENFATKVGVFVPGQLWDYRHHAFGLAGQHTSGSDKSWFPKDIGATVFNLARYIEVQQEASMEYKDWSEQSKKECARDIAEAVLSAPVKVRASSKPKDGFIKSTVRAALGRAGSAPAITRESEDDVVDRVVEELDNDNKEA